jgi:hypothetical protein
VSTPTNLSGAILSAETTPAVVRTGIVSSVTAERIGVVVGGTTISAAYLRDYTSPELGDLVAVIRQDFTWLVIGAYAGVQTNLIDNPSFEDNGPGAVVPTGWTANAFGGGAPGAVSVASSPFAVAGSNVLRIGPGGDTIVWSNQVQVTPGETYTVSVYAGGLDQPASPTADALVYALWFAAGEVVYPSAALTTDQTYLAGRNDIPNAPPMIRLTGSVVVPAAIPTAPDRMSIGLRAANGAGTSVIYDLCVLRKTADAPL